MNELVKALREPCQYENCILCQKAADAIEALQAENATLKADLAAAEKCISDVETYLEMGSGKYAYRVIQEWRGRKLGEHK